MPFYFTNFYQALNEYSHFTCFLLLYNDKLNLINKIKIAERSFD